MEKVFHVTSLPKCYAKITPAWESHTALYSLVVGHEKFGVYLYVAVIVFLWNYSQFISLTSTVID